MKELIRNIGVKKSLLISNNNILDNIHLILPLILIGTSFVGLIISCNKGIPLPPGPIRDKWGIVTTISFIIMAIGIINILNNRGVEIQDET